MTTPLRRSTALLAGWYSLGCASTPPRLSWDDAGSVLGVNTHHVGALPQQEMGLLLTAGFRWIRNGCMGRL